MKGRKLKNREKNPQTRDENQKQTQPTCDAGSGIEPRPQWWEASALTNTVHVLHDILSKSEFPSLAFTDPP